jgi:hypothetical protein
MQPRSVQGCDLDYSPDLDTQDVPTLRSEFSHPDVAVALTTLSYYYAGLNAQQMSVCFDELVKTDDPELEYSTWVQRRSRSSTPVSLQTLNGVNTKDAAQFDRDVLPAFQYNHSTIDFYLARVVFPKEAKEFPLKLSTSGWDLAERKTHVSTGFSGTNDRKYLLPTSVKQRDQPEQLGTNAMVLEYLLQDENRGYQSMCNSNGMVLSTAEFLQVINEQTPTIRVLLDVGAQMLDMKNKELVEHWLELARPQGVSAAVYFNDLDELTVLSDDGVVESFQSSPHRHSMDKVIVYLDDAHTRGTDLKLPLGTRAAVTLGPKVTKDRLVQGRTVCILVISINSDTLWQAACGFGNWATANLSCFLPLQTVMLVSVTPELDPPRPWLIHATFSVGLCSRPATRSAITFRTGFNKAWNTLVMLKAEVNTSSTMTSLLCGRPASAKKVGVWRTCTDWSAPMKTWSPEQLRATLPWTSV